jgi:hypothetical protein
MQRQSTGDPSSPSLRIVERIVTSIVAIILGPIIAILLGFGIVAYCISAITITILCCYFPIAMIKRSIMAGTCSKCKSKLFPHVIPGHGANTGIFVWDCTSCSAEHMHVPGDDHEKLFRHEGSFNYSIIREEEKEGAGKCSVCSGELIREPRDGQIISANKYWQCSACNKEVVALKNDRHARSFRLQDFEKWHRWSSIHAKDAYTLLTGTSGASFSIAGMNMILAVLLYSSAFVVVLIGSAIDTGHIVIMPIASIAALLNLFGVICASRNRLPCAIGFISSAAIAGANLIRIG